MAFVTPFAVRHLSTEPTKRPDAEEKEQDDAGGWLPPLDEETKRQKERQHAILVHKLTHSKWSDAMRSGDEKLYVADGGTSPTADSKPFSPTSMGLEVEHLWPDRAGAPRQQPLGDIIGGRVAVVTLSFQARGHGQLRSVHETLLHEFGSLGSQDPLMVGGTDSGTDIHTTLSSESAPSFAGDASRGLVLADLSFVEGLAYRLLRWAIIGGLRDSIPEHVRPFAYATFQARPQPAEELCFDADIHNRVMGHTFLLDHHGLIRWRMHADPHPSELDALVRNAHDLLAAARIDRSTSDPKQV